jgi:hypothetical protein
MVVMMMVWSDDGHGNVNAKKLLVLRKIKLPRSNERGIGFGLVDLKAPRKNLLHIVCFARGHDEYVVAVIEALRLGGRLGICGADLVVVPEKLHCSPFFPAPTPISHVCSPSEVVLVESCGQAPNLVVRVTLRPRGGTNHNVKDPKSQRPQSSAEISRSLSKIDLSPNRPLKSLGCRE